MPPDGDANPGGSMRKIAIAAVALSVSTIVGCAWLEQFTQPVEYADGTTGPSQAEDTLRTGSEVAPAFGPAGVGVSVILGGAAGILELLRRREKSTKDKVAEGLRIVAGAVDEFKVENPTEAAKVVQTVKQHATAPVRRTIDEARAKA